MADVGPERPGGAGGESAERLDGDCTPNSAAPRHGDPAGGIPAGASGDYRTTSGTEAVPEPWGSNQLTPSATRSSFSA